MSAFPGSPRVLRGAIVQLDVLSLAPLSIIPFQFNPHSMTRSFELKSGTSGSEVGQLAGVPAESIKIEVELDATDDREKGQGENGVAHYLAALEGLVTPSVVSGLARTALSMLGTIEVLPPAAPTTLFVWGPKRVLPVVVTELSVTEDAHNAELIPTLAKVSIGMRVLNWENVGIFHPGYGLSIVHHQQKEVLARLATVSSLSDVLNTTEILS